MKPYERRCVVCGLPESEVGILSRRGICQEDAHNLVSVNIDQMREKRGPFYEHWARRLIMSGHRALVASRDGEA